VRVQSYGRAAVLLPGQTEIRLDQNSTITFTPSQDEHQTWLELLLGVVHIISRDPRAIRVITPYANAGIEGTEFLVEVIEGQTRITVFEGEVSVSNDEGEASATSGSRVTAEAGRLPALEQAVVNAPDAVQWTLYYTPILDDELPSPEASPGAGQASSADFYTRRAASRLGVGRVDEAQADLAQALELERDDADALALQAMIAVTQNDRERAAELVERAIAADARSPSALIARSYVRQAFFDVNGALEDLNRAVELAPTNAHAWARLSELWLAVGDVDQGLAAAQRAVDLNPGLERTQTVLGFAHLTRIDIPQAMAAFEEAIRLHGAAPLPRLGLGLALIRDGELTAGREQVELAVILDPGNALLRSYMGKAYYEEKRDELAATQFATAKELDALDPTPWFYDAIRKQTTNEPGEALQDLQRSIELNDNRAVYRSRLLLDEDLAARSASLGRIYSDLGFERLALVQGWSSVGLDPSDYSGHRFLADAYSAVPLHQIARVNELFRSQLLQPLNITPIQPQLAEANVFILDSAGPADLAFNEFNPLFVRNRWAFQGSGVGGGNGTRGEDVVVSGVQRKLSYSIGQFHFETDGFRENNDLEQDIANAFVQFRASVNTSVQAEVRATDTEKGDLRLLFDPADYSPNLRQQENVDSLRFGARHVINQQSVFLGSLIYQDAGVITEQPGFSADTDYETHSADVQHLYGLGRWHLTSGLSYLQLDQSQISIQFPFPPFPTESTSDHTNAYLYAQLTTAGRAIITVGGSFDSVESLDVDDQWFNPKLGLSWPLTPRTTLRAAAFRTVQGPFISRQNIQPRLEPTEVAGFNQFFFSTQDEVTWHYGMAVDHEVSPGLHAGLETSRRDIDFPFMDFTSIPPVPIVVDIERQLTRAYVNYLPSSHVALSATFQYEDSDNNAMFLGEGFSDLVTKRLPVQVRYFLRSGLSMALTATYAEQKGTFENLFAPPPLPPITQQDSSFWVLDGSVAYRLPKRHGLVTLAVNNLLDEEFRFQDSDPENPHILPERVALVKFTLAY
jgi:tetratricopeptide (TPR) repeat protein